VRFATVWVERQKLGLSAAQVDADAIPATGKPCLVATRPVRSLVFM
jgi:hypothetical protein